MMRLTPLPQADPADRGRSALPEILRGQVGKVTRGQGA